jgi:hypothetical protein
LPSKIRFSSTPFNADRLIFAGLFLLVFAVYLFTLCPSFMDDDSPESIMAGVSLGLAHPPCYPLAALLNRLAGFLALGGPCFRVNVGSAAVAAFGVVLFALNSRFIFIHFFTARPPGREPRPFSQRGWICVLSASLLLAFSKTYWEKALSAKGGLYLFEMLLLLGILYCLLCLELQDAGKTAPKRWAALVFFLTGVGISHYWEIQMLFIPALLLFLYLRPGKFLKPGPWLKKTFQLSTFTLLGLSVIGLFLPLRAHFHPVLNLGDPENWNYFKLAVRRAYVAGQEPDLAKEIFAALSGHFPWARVSHTWEQMTQIQNAQIPVHLWVDVKLGGLCFALVGLWAWLKAGAGRRSLLFILASCATLLFPFYTALLIPPVINCRWYMDNFLLPTNWMLALLAGLGLWKLADYGAKRAVSPLPKILWALLVVALPLDQVVSNFSMSNEQNQMLRYDYGENLLKSAPRNAIFFAEGDEDYFPLDYFQIVEGQRPDVRVIPPFTLFETWGVSELEASHPELGLTGSSVDFPDHFARIIYSLSEIVAKNRDKNVLVFSYLPGAFHRYYWQGHPGLLAKPSGVALWLGEPLAEKTARLPFSRLRARHWDDCPSNLHPSLTRIGWIYWNLAQESR